jgi:hypothetical protein
MQKTPTVKFHPVAPLSIYF